MYDPKIARFLQEDTYRGSINDPLSLNLYAYTYNNPIKYYDPSGHIPVETILDVLSLGESIYSMCKDPSWVNAGFLVWDVVSLIPYVPGSWVAKGGKYASKIVDGAKYLDNALDVTKLVPKVSKFVGKAIKFDRAVDRVRIATKAFDGQLVTKLGQKINSFKVGKYADNLKKQFATSADSIKRKFEHKVQLAGVGEVNASELFNKVDNTIVEKNKTQKEFLLAQADANNSKKVTKILDDEGVEKATKESSNPLLENMETKVPDNEISPPNKRGNAPISDKDGKPIEIHHDEQERYGPFHEMHPSDHRYGDNYKKNHPNYDEPSKVDRKEFRKWKKEYWKKEWDKGRFK